jgi:hypothetical protein
VASPRAGDLLPAAYPPRPVRVANDVLRFTLELALLAALGFWGWWEFSGVWAWVAAAAAPLAAAAFWGTWLAPKSARRVADPRRLAAEVVAFGAGVAATARAAGAAWAIAFGALVALHLALTFALGQRRVEQSR